MTAIFISIYAGFMIISVIKPKIVVHALWLLIWLYPIGTLHALLPLNIRFDDILLLWLSLVVFIRPSGGNDSSSYMVKLSFLWFIAIVLGNLVGLMTEGGYLWLVIIRYVGKRLYIPLMAYIVWKTTRNEKEIRTHIAGILIGGLGAAIMTILQVKVPRLVIAWEQPGYLYGHGYMQEQLGELGRRGGGSLGTIYFAATAMALSLLAIRFLVRRSDWKLWFLSLFGVPIFAISLLYSNTRSSIGGLILGVVYMLVRQKRRALLILFVSAFCLYIVFGTAFIERLTARISGESGTLEGGYETRVWIWTQYLTNPSIHYFLFGRGFIAEEARFNGAAVHSSYIGAFAYTGAFGAVITFILLFLYWRYASRLIKLKGYVFANTLGEALHGVMIATLFVGIVNELLQSHPMRVIVVLGVLAERYIYLFNQGEIEYNQWDPEAGLFLVKDE